jgi:DNA-binding transcriptional ArsR family regulator
MVTKRRVSELHYRSSRICRVLGNPTAYHILRILIKNKRMPSAIADALNLSLPTVSIALRHLREIDLVRYENLREGKVSSLKDTAIETLVKRLRSREY